MIFDEKIEKQMRIKANMLAIYTCPNDQSSRKNIYLRRNDIRERIIITMFTTKATKTEG